MMLTDIQKYKSILTTDEYRALLLRYGHINDDPKSFAQIGRLLYNNAQYGQNKTVSATRAVQIVKKALAKIKAYEGVT